jgi:hypothetical protein
VGCLLVPKTTAKTKSVPKTKDDYLPDEVRFKGGKPYRNIKGLKKYLKKHGVDLKVGDKYLPPNKRGGFNAETMEMRLKGNPTLYEVWHEMAHFNHMKKIGRKEYLELSRKFGNNIPEQYVFDSLENSAKWKVLNPLEKQHARSVIENVYGGIW